MADRVPTRLVYSTGAGRICAVCGWPASDCKCSKGTADEPIPTRLVAKLRLEKKGRGGKVVSVVSGLPRNKAFLEDLCQALKRGCGTGGTVSEDTVEIQGDLRTKIRELLLARGFVVKG